MHTAQRTEVAAETRTRAPRGPVHLSCDVDVVVVVAVAVGVDGADDVDGVEDAGEVAEDGEQHTDPELHLPRKATGCKSRAKQAGKGRIERDSRSSSRGGGRRRGAGGGPSTAAPGTGSSTSTGPSPSSTCGRRRACKCWLMASPPILPGALPQCPARLLRGGERDSRQPSTDRSFFSSLRAEGEKNSARRGMAQAEPAMKIFTCHTRNRGYV